MEDSLVKYHEERRASAGGRRTRSMPSKSWPWLKVTSESSNKFTFPQVKPSNLLYETTASLACKLPMLPALEKIVALSTTKLGTKRYQTPQGAAFDLTDPFRSPPEYSVLHDPHLKEYFNTPATKGELKEKGFITKDGYVKCSIAEFNHYRTWIRKLKLDALDREKRQREAQEAEERKQREVNKGASRDGSHEIIKARQERARQVMQEKREKGEEDKRRYLKLQERDQQRIEDFKKKKVREKAVKDKQKNQERERRKSCHIKEEMNEKKIHIKFFNQKAKEEEMRRNQQEKNRRDSKTCQEKKAEELWRRRQSNGMKTMENEMVAKRCETEKRRKSIFVREENYANARRRSETLLKNYMQTNHEAAIKHLEEAERFLHRIDEKKKKYLEQLREKSKRSHETDDHGNGKSAVKPSPPGSNSKRWSSGHRKSVWDVDQCVIMDLQEMQFDEKKKKEQPSLIIKDYNESTQDTSGTEGIKIIPEEEETQGEITKDRNYLTDQTEHQLLSSLSRQMINNVLFDTAVSLGCNETEAKNHLDLSPSWELDNDITVSRDLIDQATVIINAAIDHATHNFGYVTPEQEKQDENETILETEDGTCMTVQRFVQQTVHNAMESLPADVRLSLIKNEELTEAATTTTNTKRMSLAHQPLSHKLSRICFDNNLDEFDSYTHLVSERVESQEFVEEYAPLERRPGSMCATETSLEIDANMSEREIANKIVAATLTNAIAEVIAYQTIEAAMKETNMSEYGNIQSESFTQEESWQPMRQATTEDEPDHESVTNNGTSRRVSVMFDEGSLKTAVKAVADVPRTARRASIAARLPTPKTSFTDCEALETTIDEENEVKVNRDIQTMDYPRESDFLETARRLTPYYPPDAQKSILKDLKGHTASSNPLLNVVAEESDSEYLPTPPGSSHNRGKNRCKSATKRKKDAAHKSSPLLSSSNTKMKMFFDAVKNEVENILITDDVAANESDTKKGMGSTEGVTKNYPQTTVDHLKSERTNDDRRVASESHIKNNNNAIHCESRVVKSLQEIICSGTTKEDFAKSRDEEATENVEINTSTSISHDTDEPIKEQVVSASSIIDSMNISEGQHVDNGSNQQLQPPLTPAGSEKGSKESVTDSKEQVNQNITTENVSIREPSSTDTEITNILEAPDTLVTASTSETHSLESDSAEELTEKQDTLPTSDTSLQAVEQSSSTAPEPFNSATSVIMTKSSTEGIRSYRSSSQSIQSLKSPMKSHISIRSSHSDSNQTEEIQDQQSSPSPSITSLQGRKSSQKSLKGYTSSAKSLEQLSDQQLPSIGSAISVKSPVQSHSNAIISQSDSYAVTDEAVRTQQPATTTGSVTSLKTTASSKESLKSRRSASQSFQSMKSPVNKSKSSLRSGGSMRSSTSLTSPRKSQSSLGRHPSNSTSTEEVTNQSTSAITSTRSQHVAKACRESLRSRSSVSRSIEHVTDRVRSTASLKSHANSHLSLRSSRSNSNSNATILNKQDNSKASKTSVKMKQNSDRSLTGSPSISHGIENEETVTMDSTTSLKTENNSNKSLASLGSTAQSVEKTAEQIVPSTKSIKSVPSVVNSNISVKTSSQSADANQREEIEIQQETNDVSLTTTDETKQSLESLKIDLSASQSMDKINVEDMQPGSMEKVKTTVKSSTNSMGGDKDNIISTTTSNVTGLTDNIKSLGSSKQSLPDKEKQKDETHVLNSQQHIVKNDGSNQSLEIDTSQLSGVTGSHETKDSNHEILKDSHSTTSESAELEKGSNLNIENTNEDKSGIDLKSSSTIISPGASRVSEEVRVTETNAEIILTASKENVTAEDQLNQEGDAISKGDESKSASQQDDSSHFEKETEICLAKSSEAVSISQSKRDINDVGKRESDTVSSVKLAHDRNVSAEGDTASEMQDEPTNTDMKTVDETPVEDADTTAGINDDIQTDEPKSEISPEGNLLAKADEIQGKEKEVVIYSETMDVDLGGGNDEQTEEEINNQMKVSKSVTSLASRESEQSNRRAGSRRSASSPEIPVALSRANSNARQVRSNCVFERRSFDEQTRSMKALSVSQKESIAVGKPTRSIHSNHSRSSSMSQTKTDVDRQTQEEVPSPRSHASIQYSPRPSESQQIFVTPVASAIDFTTPKRGSSTSTGDVNQQNENGS